MHSNRDSPLPLAWPFLCFGPSGMPLLFRNFGDCLKPRTLKDVRGGVLRILLGLPGVMCSEASGLAEVREDSEMGGTRKLGQCVAVALVTDIVLPSCRGTPEGVCRTLHRCRTHLYASKPTPQAVRSQPAG